MNFSTALLHLLVFSLPALGLALLLPLSARVLMSKRPAALVYAAQAAMIFVAGMAVLAGGLWLFGQDGRMATYAALVLAAATVQWALLRSGRG